MTVHAYAALEADAPLQPFSFDPAPLGEQEVEIQISHCGVCHTDLNVLDKGWGGYPCVAGHEVVGTVQARGAGVTQLEIGQRVGVGWISQSCMTCEWCLAGEENLCLHRQSTCVDRYGGFAERITIDSRFAYPIPAGLDSAQAAPLLCAGITVYAPLRRFEASAGTRVGVIGIGGLGHMALQFARALGCEVTAFSTTPEKEPEARQFGAVHFVNSKDAAQMKAARNSLDFIISTVDVNLDWNAYLKILRPKGALCIVGAIFDDMHLASSLLLNGHKSIMGSTVGNRAMMNEMLAFAAQHHITAQIETLPLSEVNTALDKVRQNKARYRMVLEV